MTVYGVMATYPARRKTLDRQIDRLSKLVDVLYVVLNEYTDVPEGLERPGVTCIIPTIDHKDVGKFIAPLPNDDSLVLLFDDDIAYPDDYAEKTIQRFIEAETQWGKPIIAGYHGTVYTKTSTQFFLNRYNKRKLLILTKDVLKKRNKIAGLHKTTHCFWEEEKHAREVHSIGTGTAIMRASSMPALKDMETSQKFVDVRLARLAAERHIPVVMLERDSLWMPKEDNDDTSIWDSFTSKNPPEFVKEIKMISALKTPEYLKANTKP